MLDGEMRGWEDVELLEGWVGECEVLYVKRGSEGKGRVRKGLSLMAFGPNVTVAAAGERDQKVKSTFASHTHSLSLSECMLTH